MRFELDQNPIGLVPGAVLKISDAGGRSLRVVEGRVWVTEEGLLDDVFVDAGASFSFSGRGTSLITADGPHGAPATVAFDVPLTIRSRSPS